MFRNMILLLEPYNGDRILTVYPATLSLQQSGRAVIFACSALVNGLPDNNAITPGFSDPLERSLAAFHAPFHFSLLISHFPLLGILESFPFPFSVLRSSLDLQTAHAWNCPPVLFLELSHTRRLFGYPHRKFVFALVTVWTSDMWLVQLGEFSHKR